MVKKPRRFATLQSWQIDYERLRVVAKIGAVLPVSVHTASSWALVAISSSFSSFIDPSNLDEFRAEVTLLHKLKHPHDPTRSLGISRRDVYCFIVTEYCPYALDAILSGGGRG